MHMKMFISFFFTGPQTRLHIWQRLIEVDWKFLEILVDPLAFLSNSPSVGRIYKMIPWNSHQSEQVNFIVRTSFEIPGCNKILII